MAIKVCHICGHGDQRMIKESLALKRAGLSIRLITKTPNAYCNYYDRVSIFGDDDSFVRAIRDNGDADIFHVHCKPSSIPQISVRALLEMGKPFVYDVHDLDLCRFEKTNVEELYALLNSRFIIYPDPAIEELVNRQLFNHLPEGSRPRTLSLLPYFSLVDLVYPCIQPNPEAVKERVKRVVYEGNVIVPAIENIKAFPYYDLRFTSFVFAQYGLEFHIYPVGIDFGSARQYYETSDAILHPPLEYPSLVREMGCEYGWGFFGAFTKSAQASNTFANKVFDYLCAGIPVAVMQADRMGQFLEETGFGVVIRSLDDISALKDDVDRWQELQSNVINGRKEWSMEERIGDLVAFYEEALGMTGEYTGIVQGEEALPIQPVDMAFSRDLPLWESPIGMREQIGAESQRKGSTFQGGPDGLGEKIVSCANKDFPWSEKILMGIDPEEEQLAGS